MSPTDLRAWAADAANRVAIDFHSRGQIELKIGAEEVGCSIDAEIARIERGTQETE